MPDDGVRVTDTGINGGGNCFVLLVVQRGLFGNRVLTCGSGRW